jgi:Glycosyl hydrolases family 16
VRVSSLQTGLFAGPLGSDVGQHRFNPAARVREEQENVRLYTPQYGRIEVRARATDDPDGMVSLWMVGLGDEVERSGEICVCEIFGRDVHDDRAAVGVGVHPFGDPQLRDDFRRVTLALDARDFHTYAADWTPEGVTFLVDGAPVAAVDQSPSYPLTLMLGIYAFPPTGEGGRHPKVFVVDHVRGSAPAEAR